MGNFDFLKAEWPEIAANAARAESALSNDPIAACVYSRRVAELVVAATYDLKQLPDAYRDDLSARINSLDFKRVVPERVRAKFDAIRRYGNTAAHPGGRRLQPGQPRACLDELFHVLVWFGLNYTTTPGTVPVDSRFDAELAKQSAPLPRAEVARIVAQFEQTDQARAAELEASVSKAAELENELAELRAQLATAQQMQGVTDTHDYDEATTRTRLIDLQLAEAGWPLDQARDREYPVTGMPNNSGDGFVDYVLWGDDGLPLAVVEAKRTTASEQRGQQQAKLYADCLGARFGQRPVIFYTNGIRTWLWDDLNYPPRAIQGFLTKDELELAIQRRTTRMDLATRAVDSVIAGRYYQSRAIKAISTLR